MDADSAEFLDDDDDQVNQVKSNDEYSSQDENTINKSLNEHSLSHLKSSTSGKLRGTNESSAPQLGSTGTSTGTKKKPTSFKSKEIVDAESNLSSTDVYDKSNQNPNNFDDQDNTDNTNHQSNNYDEDDEDNDESNLGAKSGAQQKQNNRTSFKNLFNQVIGDLSSSSEERDDEEEDEDTLRTRNLVSNFIGISYFFFKTLIRLM